MKKITVIAVSLLFLCLFTSAQKQFNNSVKLHFGGFIIPKTIAAPPGNQLGAGYERKVYKDFYVSAGYQQWYKWGDRKWAKHYVVEEPYWLDYIAKDRLALRRGYKMLDVAVAYKYSIKKQHVVSGGLGASYCWGENEYVKAFYKNIPLDIVYSLYAKDVHYWGIVPQLSYDYLFLRNRLSAGVDIRARYYSHRAPAQYDYGIHVGVNF